METFTRFPTLATSRLQLRQIQTTDEEAFFGMNPLMICYPSLWTRTPRSREDTQAWIKRMQVSYDRRESILWCIAFKDKDIVVGTCCIWNFGEGIRCAEIGYELGQKYWRQGQWSKQFQPSLLGGLTN